MNQPLPGTVWIQLFLSRRAPPGRSRGPRSHRDSPAAASPGCSCWERAARSAAQSGFAGRKQPRTRSPSPAGTLAGMFSGNSLHHPGSFHPGHARHRRTASLPRPSSTPWRVYSRWRRRRTACAHPGSGRPPRHQSASGSRRRQMPSSRRCRVVIRRRIAGFKDNRPGGGVGQPQRLRSGWLSCAHPG